VPVAGLGRKKFYKQGGMDPDDPASREAYYEEVLGMVGDFGPDLIALSGYMHIVSDPLLKEYGNRIFNVHPADLAILRSKGKGPVLPVETVPEGHMDAISIIRDMERLGMERAYKGEDAVADAVLNGEEFVRSTVHIATEVFDEGPIVVRSKRMPVDTEYVKKKLGMRDWGSIVGYAHGLQNELKLEGDGPAFAKALELAALGMLGLDGQTVCLDGKPLPYGGYVLEDRF
jgi:hypothetical protein